MNFNGQNVRAGNEIRRGDYEREESAFVRADDVCRSQCVISDRPGGHIVAEHLAAIEINDRAVVTNEREREIGDVSGGIGNVEGAAKISGDVLVVGVGAVVKESGFVAIAVTELGRADSPGGIIEGGCAPAGALVGTVIEV